MEGVRGLLVEIAEISPTKYPFQLNNQSTINVYRLRQKSDETCPVPAGPLPALLYSANE